MDELFDSTFGSYDEELCMVIFMKVKGLLIIICLLLGLRTFAVDLKTEGLDSVYVQTIVERAQKITDQLSLEDATKALDVRNIIANRYFLLNGIHENYKKALEEAKTLSGETKQQALQHAADRRDAELYKHHFEFEADLQNYLSPTQIEMVKDGMTYGVVPKTYQAHLEMIPTLTEEEKSQILSWLKEAREFAIDADTSKDKHGWFGKYKGRINNWLSSRGYDLQKEREGWQKRIEEKEKAE